MKTIELKPIKENTEDYEAIERALIELFRQEIYIPLLKEIKLKPITLKNSIEDLISSLQSGRITYSRGYFRGDFNSETSKELKKLGAIWDRTQGCWKVPKSALPKDIITAVNASEFRFQEKIAALDKKLSKLSPEIIAEKLQVSKFFDTALWKVQRDFKASVKGITVAPELTEKQTEQISKEWQNNMKISIKDFSEREIKKLRSTVRESTFDGNRYETLVKGIQSSYGVSKNKAKFLARQETNLLVSKFKQTRYEDAGVMEYKWMCAAGSKLHPVRPAHKMLEGKVFRWDDPPITDSKGNRNNPGQDYNCRCYARPIVRLK